MLKNLPIILNIMPMTTATVSHDFIILTKLCSFVLKLVSFCIHTYILVHIYTCIHSCAHARTRTHTHTHTHTHILC